MLASWPESSDPHEVQRGSVLLPGSLASCVLVSGYAQMS